MKALTLIPFSNLLFRINWGNPIADQLKSVNQNLAAVRQNEEMLLLRIAQAEQIKALAKRKLERQQKWLMIKRRVASLFSRKQKQLTKIKRGDLVVQKITRFGRYPVQYFRNGVGYDVVAPANWKAYIVGGNSADRVIEKRVDGRIRRYLGRGMGVGRTKDNAVTDFFDQNPQLRGRLKPYELDL